MAVVQRIRMILNAPGGEVECYVDIDDADKEVKRVRTVNNTGAPVRVFIWQDGTTDDVEIPVGENTQNIQPNRYFLTSHDEDGVNHIPWYVQVYS